MDIRDYGLRGAENEKIYDFPQREKGIILTGDKGFGNLLLFPLGSHFGIVVADFPNEIPAMEINRFIIEQFEALTEDDFKGNLIIIEPEKIRIRRK